MDFRSLRSHSRHCAATAEGTCTAARSAALAKFCARREGAHAIRREFSSWRTGVSGYPSNSTALSRLRPVWLDESFHDGSNLEVSRCERLTGTFFRNQTGPMSMTPPMPPYVPGLHESTLKGRARKDPPSAKSRIPK